MNNQAPKSAKSEARAAKVNRLTRFILDDASHAASGSSDRQINCLVIAKSADSAVVAAIEAARKQTGPDKLALRIICAEAADSLTWPNVTAQDEIRMMGNSSLMDAHERLIVGATSVWTGDSLRRAPDKIDAFEAFDANDEAATLWAARSFEKLWNLAVPARPLTRDDGADAQLIHNGSTVRVAIGKPADQSRH
ncbi:MAG: hypothetical protein AAGC70_03435 [Pseudomonadota bacterium]